jgi:hypothetical protein
MTSMVIAGLLVLVRLSGSSNDPAVSGFQSSRDGGCTEWRECRRLALAAADRGDYETFHDLAWRAVQTGPSRDPALMYLLARAQALSGRAHDALVMLQRLAEMGVPSDAASNEDFRWTRELPGWPELAARFERAAHPDMPPAVAATSGSASPAAPAPPPASTPAPLAEAARFSTDRFSFGGLAYDAVSQRLLLGDRFGRKLIVVGDGSNHTVDLVRADSAGFHDISAIEIDARRGDLWVASTEGGNGAGTLHHLQLVSGRPLKAVRVADDLAPVALVDLAVTPAGAVLVLDSVGRQLLVLRSGAVSIDRSVRIDAEELASVAAAGDERTVYVAHRDGVSRIDLRARTARRLEVPKGTALGRLERIRWYRDALIAVAVDDDGSRRIVRLDLNAGGAAVTQVTTLDASLPAAGAPSVTVSGDELFYVVAVSQSAADGPSPGPAEFVAYRLRLR